MVETLAPTTQTPRASATVLQKLQAHEDGGGGAFGKRIAERPGGQREFTKQSKSKYVDPSFGCLLSSLL
jgi:hypothetical protein